MGVRRALAVNAGKAVAATSRLLGRGGGTALPGLLATRMYPPLVGDLAAQLGGGRVVVAGTNGKTTTSRILAGIVRAAGFGVIWNESGSNLARGLASALLMQTDMRGDLRQREHVGIFEVDEAALPGVLRVVTPSTLILLDLFRDQLDRYGEVATIARLWSAAVERLTPDTCLVVNADDPLLVEVAGHAPSRPLYFGVESAARELAGREHGSDVKACPRCGGEIEYSAVFLGHLGHYRCTACALTRPQPDVAAFDVRSTGLEGNRFTLAAAGETVDVALLLPGLYNVYNATAAAAGALSRGIPLATVSAALATATAAFGRMERLTIRGSPVTLALAKNPTGLNEVLRTLLESTDPLNLLMMLNDNAADGRDVSWIWDADVEMLGTRVASAVFSGTRAEDMALRFKYAEVLGDTRWAIQHDLDVALDLALDLADLANPGSESALFVVPTYTALLQIRDVLVRRGYLRPYWEE